MLIEKIVLLKWMISFYMFCFLVPVAHGSEICISKEENNCKDFPSGSFFDLESAFISLGSKKATSFNITLVDSLVIFNKSFANSFSENVSIYLTLTGGHSDGTKLSLKLFDPFKDLPFASLNFKNITLVLDIIPEENDKNNIFTFGTSDALYDYRQLSFKNCTFSSLHNISLNILKIAAIFLKMEEINFENIKVGTFLELNSSKVVILNSSFGGLICNYFIKGNPQDLTLANSTYFNLSILGNFIDINEFMNAKLMNNIFYFFSYNPSSSFIKTQTGKFLDIRSCILKAMNLNNFFVSINNTNNIQMSISNCILSNFSSKDKPLIFDNMGMVNSIIISNSSFENFFLDDCEFVELDARKTNLVIENSIFSKFNFCNHYDREEGIFLSMLGWDCALSILSSKFLFFDSTRIFISQMFYSKLNMSSCILYQFLLKQTSSIINVETYNILDIVNLTFIDFEDTKPGDKVFERGFIINAEIGNIISIKNTIMKNIFVTKISELFFIYYMNSISFENTGLLNLTYNCLASIFNIYTLYWGNNLTIIGNYKMKEVKYTNNLEGYFNELNIANTHYFNYLNFLNAIISFEDTFIEHFVKCLEYGSDSKIYLTNITIVIGGGFSKFDFLFVLRASAWFNITLLKLEASYFPTNSILILSVGSKSIIINGLFINDYCSELIRDVGSWMINLENVSIKTNNTSPAETTFQNPISLFSFENNSKISIANLSVEKLNMCKHIIFVKNCKDQILITSSVFSDILLRNEASLLISLYSNSLKLVKCEFKQNIGFLNGLVFIDFTNSSTIQVSGNYFYRNEPAINCDNFSRGGALYLRSPDSNYNIDQILLFDNIFLENSADFGSAIFLDIRPEEISKVLGNSTNFFDGKQAMHTNQSASMISKFIITDYLGYSRQLNKNERLFNVTGIDYFNNTYTLFDFPINISEKSHLFYCLSVEWSEKRYYIRLSNIDVDFFVSNITKTNGYFEIDERFNIFFTGLYNQIGKPYSVHLKLIFQCLAGNFFDPRAFDCRPCQPNTMKLRKNVDKQCDLCNYNKINNCVGGNKLLLKEGYYRTEKSPLIFRCKNIHACFPTNCGERYRNDSFLCSRCNQDSGLTLSWECIDCTNAYTYLSFFFFVSLIIFLKAYSVKKAYKLTKNLKNKKANTNKSKNYSVFQLATTNSSLKILNIHFAFILSLNSYPFGALETLRNSSGPGWITFFTWNLNFMKFSWECIFKAAGIKYEGVLVAIFARISQPALIVVIWIVYYSLKLYLSKKKMKNEEGPSPTFNSSQQTALRRNGNILASLNKLRPLLFQNLIIELMNHHYLESIILIALSISYEEIIMGLGYYLFYFDSKEDETPTKRMLHEPYTLVDQEKYNFSSPFLIFFLVFFGLLVPLYIIARLNYAKKIVESSKKNKRNPKDAQINPFESYKLFVKYGYFYYQYKKSHYYYEIFYMLKRIVYLTYNVWLIPLIAIHTKYDENIAAFINFEVILIWIFYLIHNYSKPFRSELKVVNNLESLSSIILLTSYFFSALFFNNADPISSIDYSTRMANLAFFFVLWTLNLLFFSIAIWIIFKNEEQNIRRSLLNLRTIIYYFVRVMISFLIWVCTCFRKGKLDNFNLIRKTYNVNLKKKREHESSIEINPLASWKSVKSKEIGRIHNQKTADTQSISKTFKRKLETLSLLVKYQRSEIKELKRVIERISKGLSQQTDFLVRDPFENLSDNTDSLGVNEFHDDIKSNLRIRVDRPLNPSAHEQIEVMSDILVREDPSPNKVLNSFSEIKIESQPSLEKGVPVQIDFEEKPNSFKQNFEEQLLFLTVNEVIGTDYRDYFIKTKVVLKNQLEDLTIREMSFSKSADLYVKFKRKLDFPCDLKFKNVLKLVFYVREVKLEVESRIDFLFNICCKEISSTRKISIKYENLDFIKLNKSSFIDSYFFSSNQKNTHKRCRIDFFHERVIGPKPNLLVAFNYSFPELFHEEFSEADISPTLKIPRGKFAKRMGLKLETKWPSTLEPIFKGVVFNNQTKLKRTGRFQIFRYKIQLTIEISVIQNQANMVFTDLEHPSKEGLNITLEELKNLLDAFLDSRLL